MIQMETHRPGLIGHRKKLIEVALPLDAINEASAHEKMPGIGAHPRGLHQWWARRPLAAARAVIFAQMVDDPSANTEQFPTAAEQAAERQRLFRIIEELVKWENTANQRVLGAARKEILRSWRRTCVDHKDHPRAKQLFDPERLPAFHDPFAGGGALPLEAQRLGLEAHASDLNPVAVLISKAMIEIPQKFAGRPPVNPEARSAPGLVIREWLDAQGMADDVRYYGQWMRDEAERRIGDLYPKVEVTREMVRERPDLKPYEGRELTVIAWLWARTVKSPNPAFSHARVPLVSTFMLSTKKGKQAYIKPAIEGDSYRFEVRTGTPSDLAAARKGTKSGGSGSEFLCMMSGTPMPFAYLREEARSGRMGSRLMAIVAQGSPGRVYLPPTPEMQDVASRAKPRDTPESRLPEKALGFRVQQYGMLRWRDLFTSRQLVALTTFSDLVATRRELSGALRDGLPRAIAILRSTNIAPVDLAQAAIGPGMALYTRYAKVLSAQGGPVSVHEALALINEVLDEVFAEHEGDFDTDTRWALAWFEERGFERGDFGVAEALSKAKNTSIGGLVEAGILESRGGQVRLLSPSELPPDWDPTTDARLTAWETVHHLIRILESDGEEATAALARRLGGVADVARDLAYRLYSIAERKKRAAEALQYNSLVGSWVEIKRLASAEVPAEQTELL